MSWPIRRVSIPHWWHVMAISGDALLTRHYAYLTIGQSWALMKILWTVRGQSHASGAPAPVGGLRLTTDHMEEL